MAAGRTDREHLRAIAGQQHGVVADMPGNHAAIGQLVGRYPES
jgi:hypothetical protein